jgi:hypothetical protein
MTRTTIMAAALALAVTLLAVPAQALVPRTFVSAAGSDSNSCANVATPCRHFAAAYAATAPNGEIYVLDPANYGSLTITGPVSIEGHGWASIAPTAGNPAITITANAGDKINIVGVVLDGTNLTATVGIQFNSGGSLTVRDSVIRNFGGQGINFAPNAANATLLAVSNTLVSDMGGDGIDILPSGSGPVSAVLSRVDMEGNSGDGLSVLSSGPATNVTVSDSVASNNATNGIVAQDLGGTVSIMVRNSTIANNGFYGLESDGAGATIRVTRSTITGNATGWLNFNSGVVLSYGDNNIDGNTNANTEPPNPLGYH